MDKKQIVDLVLWINSQGWSPATSTNYSIKNPVKQDHLFISKSGVDKSLFTSDDFLEMSVDGEKAEGFENIKSSAETEIHLSLYKNTDAQVILHTHSVADTIISRLLSAKKEVVLKNYEVLKGLVGIETHEVEITIPIFGNTQDISLFSSDLENYIINNKKPFYGFLMESHGFYTWGKNISESKRHLEVFQFLFLCELELLKIK